MDLHKLKQANDIFERLTRGQADDPLQQLNTFEDLDEEVLELVKALLTNHQQSSLYFNQHINQMLPSTQACPFDIGDQLGEYRLTELIGQGGMATVFKAKRATSNPQKAVAIKIFSLADQSPALHQRFLAEQRILASLSHPNIIDFHHGETNDQGHSFLVMELLQDALPIDQHISRHALSTEQVISLIRQVADGLMFAHNHLIIHRDVKPSNILVTPQGQVKLLDFGIAKLISSDNQADPNQTILALTPHYASPEQITASQIDVTTDVFSLAAVTVFLLTGKQPFPANRLLNNCQHDEEHLSKILKSAVPSRELRNLLNKALRQDKTLRYQNMFAFDEDLSNVLDHKPVSASPDTWWYRLSRFAVRRRALFSTSLVLMLTVITAVTGLSLQNQAIKAEAQKADAVKAFMLEAFSVTDPGYSQGVDITAKDLLSVAAEKINQDLVMDDDIKFELELAMAVAHGKLGFYPEAIGLLNDALDRKPHHQQATALLAQYLFNAARMDELAMLFESTDEAIFSTPDQRMAWQRVKANHLAQSGEHQAAIDLFQQFNHSDLAPTELIKNQALLAEIHYLNGNSTESIQIVKQLKKDHPLPATDPMNLALNSDLVQYHDRLGNFSEAMALTAENIRLFKLILGDQHPDLGLAYNALSTFQRLDGRLDDAITSARTSEAIYRQRYGNSSEGLAQALSNMGVAHFYQGKSAESIEKLSMAANMLIEIFGVEHPEAMSAQYNLATILNASDRPAEALPILKRIYHTEVQTVGKHNRNALSTQGSLALTLAKAGQIDEALEHIKENIDLIQENLPDNHYLLNSARRVMGDIYHIANDFEKAIEQFEWVLNNWSQGSENLYSRVLKHVAECHLGLQQHDQAIEYLQQWTAHSATVYGQSDSKHLQHLLDAAQHYHSIGRQDLVMASAETVQNIMAQHQINDDDLQRQINALNQQ